MDIEIIRVADDLWAYVRIQDEWTGNYKNVFRKVHTTEEGHYIVKVDGRDIDCDFEARTFLAYERNVKLWKDFYRNKRY